MSKIQRGISPINTGLACLPVLQAAKTFVIKDPLPSSFVELLFYTHVIVELLEGTQKLR